jgi:predicted enzyme related to lactoylglutathione lyase
MTDPFDVLRAPLAPVQPDPEFDASLRARVERALALPRGVAVSAAAEPTTEPATVLAPPRSAAIPYLAIRDARRALDWYADVFGAEIVGEPIVMPDGRIGHAELAISDGVIYLADEHPEIGVAAPRPGEATVSLMLNVSDADEVRARALAAGATGDREPYDAYGTRNAWIVDPFGHRWGLQSPLSQPVSERIRGGDAGFVWLSVPDLERAEAFYGAVLGWQFAPRRADIREITNVSRKMHLAGSAQRGTLSCAFAVEDIEAAVAAVRTGGGQSTDPEARPHGMHADCTDDQGTAFSLYQPLADDPRPAMNGNVAGDLAYLTLEVVDSARAREFYGAVLGWTYTPGSIEDGWQVEDVAPMTGLSGGHERATGVPMWLVADIDAAVAAVRAAGGTSTDPQRQPYGISATCTDDQGVRFYLGQL